MEHKEYKKRNKGGRPKKETAEKLSYRIGVKMAAADYFRLLTRAHEAGVSPSKYMRECFRNGHVKERLSEEHTGYTASSAAWRTISTSLRIRLTLEASTTHGGTVRWLWHGFTNS